MGDHQTFIALDFCKAVIPEPVAQKMLDRMVEHIRKFHDDIHGPVGIAGPQDTAMGLTCIAITIPIYSTTSDDDSGLSNGQLGQLTIILTCRRPMQCGSLWRKPESVC